MSFLKVCFKVFFELSTLVAVTSTFAQLNVDRSAGPSVQAEVLRPNGQGKRETRTGTVLGVGPGGIQFESKEKRVSDAYILDDTPILDIDRKRINLADLGEGDIVRVEVDMKPVRMSHGRTAYTESVLRVQRLSKAAQAEASPK